MTISRRTFLRGAVAAVGALCVPTWLPRQRHAINLSAFCVRPGGAPISSGKYDMAQPFVQGTDEPYRYATDARICVRVPEPNGSLLEETAKAPPASALGWDHGPTRWLPWPKPAYIDLDDEECPECCGRGHHPVWDCSECQGTGQIRYHSPSGFSDWDEQCSACRGTGWGGPGCPTCKGKGYGRFPAVQQLANGLYVAVRYHGLVARELADVEYAFASPNQRAVQLRFSGGSGLLMPMDLGSLEGRRE